MSRPLYAQVNLAALRDNVATARRLANGAQVFAVVKANAYGHGLARVLPALGDADGLGLIELERALELRAARYTRRILLLEGFFAVDELAEIANRRLAVVVHHEEQVRMLEAASVARPIEVFVKVNTGMNRLGFAPTDVTRIVERLTRCDSVATLRMMTHFARSDESDGIKAQLASFEQACSGLAYPRSMANSAGTIRYDEVGGDIVRPGIMLYGATPFADRSAAELGLRPVMTLRSEIIAVQTLARGDTVGYGATYTADGTRRVGVVACGYADGYPRHALTGTPVQVAGRITGTVGRVSMDMLAVDLTDLPEAGVGSPVVLWGEGVPVDIVANACGTVGYELLCAVAPRVPFVVSELGQLDLEL